MSSTKKTAGIIIIGDEILSGRVKDQNSPFLIKELSIQGVHVKYCLTIPDDLSIIADAVGSYSPKVTWLFTAGGVGPTHDDITIEGIGKAFDTPIITSPELEKMIRKTYGDRFRSEHLKMAQIPDGTKLVGVRNPRFPIACFRNVYILPGVPEFLQTLFLSIKDLFQGEKVPFREIHLVTEEGVVASTLRLAIARYPGAKIGSYPCFKERDCIVKLVVEHENQTELDNILAFLEDNIGRFIQK